MGGPPNSAEPREAKEVETIADFELRECLRAGELAEVYRAWDRENQRWVTLARLRPEVALRPGVSDHFLHAASQVSTIAHRSLVPLKLGADELGIGFVLEPEQDGPSLEQVIAGAPHGLPMRDAIALIEPIAEALALAHARGVAHGRVVAERIVLAEDAEGRVPKLRGFGLSDAGELASVSPERMHSIPPERFAGQAPDPAADVYALAALLYELIAGEPPPAEEAALLAVVDAPPELSRVVARCLSRKPHERPTARALHTLLAKLKRQSLIMRSATPLAMRAVQVPAPVLQSAPAANDHDAMAELASELGAVLEGLEDFAGAEEGGVAAPALPEERAPVPDQAEDDLMFDTVGSPPPPAFDRAHATASRAPQPPAPNPPPETDGSDELEFDLGGETDDAVSAEDETVMHGGAFAPDELATVRGHVRPLSSLPPQLQQALRGEVPGSSGAAADEWEDRELDLLPPPSALRPAALRAGSARSMPPPVPRAAGHSRAPNSKAPRRASTSLRTPTSARPSAAPRSGSSSTPVRALPPPPPRGGGSLPALPSVPTSARPASPPAVDAAHLGRSARAPSRSPSAREIATQGDGVWSTAPSLPAGLAVPERATPQPRHDPPRTASFDARAAAWLAAWTAGFAWLAPLYYARDFGALDALLGFGRAWAALFVGLSAAMAFKLHVIARAERDRGLRMLCAALFALAACALLLTVASVDGGLLPSLLVLGARLGMSWGGMLFLIALSILATRRILIARRDSLAVTALLALLTLEGMGATAWLLVHARRIDAGESTQQPYDVRE